MKTKVEQNPDTLQWTYHGHEISEEDILGEELRTGNLRTDPEFQEYYDKRTQSEQVETETFNKQVKAAGGTPNPQKGFSNVDWNFIKTNEGFETTGYVPMNKDGTAKGHSGVTIASGFDLGSRTVESLRGLPENIITKLKPFLGLQKEAAIEKAADLSLTSDEADVIDQWAKKSTMKSLRAAWLAATGESFDTLPQHKATPIADLVFNHGLEATKGYNFWKQVTTDDWKSAEANLRNFGEKDPDLQPRRTRGADYFARGNK